MQKLGRNFKPFIDSSLHCNIRVALSAFGQPLFADEQLLMI